MQRRYLQSKEQRADKYIQYVQIYEEDYILGEMKHGDGRGAQANSIYAELKRDPFLRIEQVPRQRFTLNALNFVSSFFCKGMVQVNDHLLELLDNDPS